MDIPDELYRQVKAKSALEGRCVREVAVTLFDSWVREKSQAVTAQPETPAEPAWFGALHNYASHADGQHGMDQVRESIARNRKRGPS